MKYLKFILNDGRKLVLDEWERTLEGEGTDDEIDYYWGSICGKCIERFGGKYNFSGHLHDSSTGCCSVCGCTTPSYWDSGYEDDGTMYIDFDPEEVTFFDDSNSCLDDNSQSV